MGPIQMHLLIVSAENIERKTIPEKEKLVSYVYTLPGMHGTPILGYGREVPR